MSMNRKRLIALLIASAFFCISAAATLSSREAPNADQAEAAKRTTSDMLQPSSDSPEPPTWLVSDFSWM